MDTASVTLSKVDGLVREDAEKLKGLVRQYVASPHLARHETILGNDLTNLDVQNSQSESREAYDVEMEDIVSCLFIFSAS